MNYDIKQDKDKIRLELVPPLLVRRSAHHIGQTADGTADLSLLQHGLR